MDVAIVHTAYWACRHTLTMETIAENNTPGSFRVNIEVPRDLWRKVKAQAALEERPARYLVEDALRAYLKTAKR